MAVHRAEGRSVRYNNWQGRTWTRIPEEARVGSDRSDDLRHALATRHSVVQMKRDWKQGIEFDRQLRENIGWSLESLPSEDFYSPFWSHWWQVVITAVVASTPTTMKKMKNAILALWLGFVDRP